MNSTGGKWNMPRDVPNLTIAQPSLGRRPLLAAVGNFCTMRGRCEFRLRLIGQDWLLASWTVERTAPIEGSEKVDDLAAARSSR